MSLVVQADPVPLDVDEDGSVRVAGSRVTLDTIVAMFRQGASPEEIAEHFPTISLADVYAVVTFYLRHQADVESYLRQGEERATAIRQKQDGRLNRAQLRERLLARRAGRH